MPNSHSITEMLSPVTKIIIINIVVLDKSYNLKMMCLELCNTKKLVCKNYELDVTFPTC